MRLLLFAHLMWHSMAQSGILAILTSLNRYGPFGPWQAPGVLVGTRMTDNLRSEPWTVAFYPLTGILTGRYHRTGSRFYSATSSGSYTPTDSDTATLNDTGPYTDELSPVDDSRGVGWHVETAPVNISMRVVDKIVYYGKYQGTPETPHEINAIGFGYGLYPESDPIKVDHGFELLHELKASQAIGSKSFGFHLGIAGGLDSGAGSLTLGGYDRSRVIGQPAVFDALPLTDLAVFLVDVVVGVQVGDSPFELIAHPTSFFSSSALESSLSEERGGKSGSLLVQVDPQKPHMGLPTATCNSLARHLPVTWDSRLELNLDAK
ncbi:hypothetical protein GGTG_07135 [Gaeumannomyces tritici R3-111a-1]|uniref:Peptidase A1 domain-containing protein n=1 Tax=Gaeumannomyces tritici (strain R3-111a-1) TaxID=644352 RepID=J3P0U0_GAET3|nr:hypothetical protein GGTG_07135 [Gaeumannomyces tritici R3-111a-1]EJT77223.1 hypothetical protein GGTG_07135 [Gaeumannomyces tritici R3-111a-1]